MTPSAVVEVYEPRRRAWVRCTLLPSGRWRAADPRTAAWVTHDWRAHRRLWPGWEPGCVQAFAAGARRLLWADPALTGYLPAAMPDTLSAMFNALALCESVVPEPFPPFSPPSKGERAHA